MSKKTLADACMPMSSNIAQKDLAGKEGQYPIYGASGLIGFVDFYKQECQYIAVVKDGAGVGRVFCLPPYSSVIGTLQYLIPKEGVDVNYLSYAIQFMHLEKYYTGATIPHIYFKDYKREPLNLPALEAQQQIAETLGDVDEAIEILNELLSRHDDLVKSRFIEMFGDPVTNPMGWETASIRDTSELISDGPFGSNLKSSHYVANGIRVIRLGNIGAGKFLDDDKAYISEEHYETLKKYTCRAGEIVIGTLGEPNLRACLIPDDIDISVNKSDCVHFIPKTNKLNNTYACAYLNTDGALQLAQGSLHGQTRSRIAMSQVAALPIMLPPLELQNQFADFVQLADKSKFKEILHLQMFLKHIMVTEFFRLNKEYDTK